MRKHKTVEDHIFSLVIAVVMTLVVIMTVYPFWYILVQSFNDGQDAIRGGIYFWPRVFSIDKYSTLLAQWYSDLCGQNGIRNIDRRISHWTCGIRHVL